MWSSDRGVLVGGIIGLTHFCVDECDEEMCRLFSTCGKLLLLMLLCDALCLYLFVGGSSG